MQEKQDDIKTIVINNIEYPLVLPCQGGNQERLP